MLISSVFQHTLSPRQLLYSPINVKIRKDLIKCGFPNASEITTFFSNDTIPSLDSFSPELDAFKNPEKMLFFFILIERGFFKIIVKSISRIDCFSVSKSIKLIEFDKLLEISKWIIDIIDELEISFQQITDNLYQWYTNHSLKLKSSPQKVIFYECLKEINEADIKDIQADFDRKKESRLTAFDQLIQLIESEQNPAIGISQHLGIKMSD